MRRVRKHELGAEQRVAVTIMVTASNMYQDITSFPNSVAPPDDNPLNLSFFTTQSTYGDLTTFIGAGNATNRPASGPLRVL